MTSAARSRTGPQHDCSGSLRAPFGWNASCARGTGSSRVDHPRADRLRDFRGAMAGRGEKGLLFTTASFTPAAQQEATRDGVPPIDLIDGDLLCDLLARYRVGVHVRERTVQDVTIDDGFWDTFE